MTETDALDSDYFTYATAVLFAGVFISYCTLFFFGNIPVQRLWYGLDKIGIPQEILLIPILLSGIGFIYLFVYCLFLIDNRDETMLMSLQFMYLAANLWAFFLYSSENVSTYFKWPTVLSLWGITITSSIILYKIVDLGKAGEPYELIGILLGTCVVVQSLIDSTLWAVSFYYSK
jgi:hypothetical protein